MGRSKLLWIILAAFMAGYAVGFLARLLVWSRVETLTSDGSYGLSHYLAGLVSPLLKAFSPVYGLAFPSFFTGYELGEWVLGDEPFSELESFALGLAAGLALVWLINVASGRKGA